MISIMYGSQLCVTVVSGEVTAFSTAVAGSISITIWRDHRATLMLISAVPIARAIPIL